MTALRPRADSQPAPAVAGRRQRLRRGLARTLALLALPVLAALILDRRFPLPLPDPQRGATLVLARDGTPLRAFADADGVWRYPSAPEQVSPLYLQALLGYEDRWFWKHPGVNPVALARAAWQWLRHGRIVSGGSTLSMQVARILDPVPRTPLGKLRQMLRALQLEAHLSKRQILTLYLDHAPFGGTLEGVEAASWAYLGKPARRLSRAEAALLAVLPQAPSELRPDRHPQAARAARDKVLARMRTLGVWTPEQVASARQEPVLARSLRPPLSAALLAQRLHAARPQARRIVTTLDAELQRAVEARVGDYLARLPEHTSAALLVVDNATLEARVYVGSGAFGDEARLGHVDMVDAPRSPGSTLKPFLYGLALDDGLIHSESLLVDAPQDFGGYRPGNFDEAYAGPVSAAEALQRSLNVPAVDLLDRVGPSRFVARLANAGLRLRLPDGDGPNLSIVLGGAGTTLEELVGAYTALAEDGVAGTPRYTADAPRRRRRLLSPGAAWIVRAILEANPRPGYAPGEFDLSARTRVAWKTGTSYGYRDAWAIGATRRWTVGVWIGRPDGTPMPGQYGAVTALPLLFQVVDMLPQPPRRLLPEPPPATVRMVDVCWPLGLAFDPAQPQLCRRHRRAWTLNGVVPPTFAERDGGNWNAGALALRVDVAGRRLSAGCRAPHERVTAIARWPALATPWLGVAERRRSALPPLAPGCPADALDEAAPLHIDGVQPGATLARAPGADRPAQIALRALGAQGEVLWLLNGRLAGRSEGAAPITLALAEPGEQTLTALSRRGAYAQVRFEVLR